jgi:hypothetical protein
MRKTLQALLLIALAALVAAPDGRIAGRDGLVATAAAQSETKVSRPANARADLSDRWLNADGRYIFPPDDGFAAPPQDVTLAPGTMIDRYGQPGGRFLAPTGTPYEARAMPYDRSKMDYYRYEVLKPLPVKAGTAAPWFDQAGGGVQYKTELSVQQLIAEGYLREIR